jgi:hypothetical protein
MKDLLITLLVSVGPIVIMIPVIIKLVLGTRKNAAAREEAQPVLAPVQNEEPGAWSLVPDDDEGEVPVKPTPIPAPAVFSKSQFATLPSSEPAFPASSDPAPPEPPLFREVPSARTKSPPAAGLFGHIGHLSPIRQAVILAEILGPPKGMA